MSAIDPKTRLEEGKRPLPPALRKLLEWDVLISKKFVSFLLNFVSMRSFKTHCMFLEYSCHGVVWIVSVLALCWIIDTPGLVTIEVNILFGLILDITFVAILKAATRRRRPTAIEDDIFTIGPDKFSFPSGHASRAFFILFFFTVLHPLAWWFWPPLFAWSVSVALSRLILYKHHILDVLAGIGLGLLEGVLMSFLWLSDGTANFIMSRISEDSVPGGPEEST